MKKMYGEQDPTSNAAMEGLLNEDTLTYTLTRDAGENAGSYKITPHGDSIQKNCEVIYQTGSLTITESNLMKLEASSSKKVYDAKPFTQQAIPSVEEGSIVLYSLDCRTCKQDQPYITDAGVLNVKAKVEHPNYETVTIDYTLEIIPRKVTLTSATAKKQYDGKPLTNKTVVVSGEDFVSEEGTTYKVTGTITDVGSIKNTFTYTLYKGTKKENYQITNV